MRAPSGLEILRLWEAGRDQHPVERGVTTLAACSPGLSWEMAAALPFGERESQLLHLREATFGPVLECSVECPRCHEALEFSLRTDELDVTAGEADAADLAADDEYQVRFRLPSSEDLLGVAGSADAAAARQALLEGCVTSASREGSPVRVADLPVEVVSGIAARMDEGGPGADLRVDLQCPICGHGWESVLDIAGFFWAEIAAEAKRLVHEVHTLARAYGWSEAEILQLSDWRRSTYLELVGE